jgi:hypothetical protein
MNKLCNKSFDWDAEEEFCDLANDEIDESPNSKLVAKIGISSDYICKINPLAKKGSLRRADYDTLIKDLRNFNTHSQLKKNSFDLSPKRTNNSLESKNMLKKEGCESPVDISSKSICFTNEIRTLLHELSESRKKGSVYFDHFRIDPADEDVQRSPECFITMDDVEAAI